MKTGTIAWQDRSFARAQLLHADGKLVILDEDGTLGLATVSPQGLKVLARANVLTNLAWTPPTLVGTSLVRARSQDDGRVRSWRLVARTRHASGLRDTPFALSPAGRWSRPWRCCHWLSESESTRRSFQSSNASCCAASRSPAPEQIVNVISPGPKPGSRSTSDSGRVEAVFSYPLFRDLERLENGALQTGRASGYQRQPRLQGTDVRS